MRYACVTDAAAYQLSDADLEQLCREEGAGAGANDAPEREALAPTKEATDAAQEVKEESPPARVCPLCLGCLEQCVKPEAIASVAQVVLSSGHDLRDFALAIAVPPPMLLRERGGWLHLQRARAAALAASGGGYSLIGGMHSGRKAAEGIPPYGDLVDVKEAMRWAMVPALSKALGVPCDGSSALIVRVQLSHDGSAGEHHDIMSKLVPAEKAYMKRKRSAQSHPPEYDSIRNVMRALSMERGERADNLISASRLCPPPSPLAASKLTVSIERASISLTGRYCKYSRQLPQSPWILDGSRKAEGSVQECITEHVVPLFAASEARFHSAGREDIDVRMLGTGRPFTLELLCPKRPFHDEAALAAAAEAVNKCGLVWIDGLRVCDLVKLSEAMRDGEEAHRKDYRCCVVLSRHVTPADLERINGTTELVTQQLTPMRVLHRRTLMVRERTIHAMRAEKLGSRFLQLDLTTQAGTYVKEFVHGDFGRTSPSLGALLGCEADIIQLDVMGLQD